MELREIIIWLGLIAIAAIVWDGIRRMKKNKRAVPAADEKKTIDPEALARQAQIERELPRGGARVREMTDDEKSSLKNRLNLRARVPMLMERVEVQFGSKKIQKAAAESEAAEQAEMDFTSEVAESKTADPVASAEADPGEGLGQIEDLEQIEDFGPAEKVEPFFGEEVEVDELEQETSPETAKAGAEPAVEEAVEDSGTPDIKPEPDETTTESAGPVEDLVIMNVMAKEGSEFSGSDILELLLASGLRHGPMDIFHYRNPKGQTEFSLANCVQPGVFNPDSMSQVTTPGLTLFLQLPSTADTMESFEHMYEMAQYLARKLGGDVRDEDRNAVTAQRCEFYREKLRNFVRSKLLPSQ